MGGSCHDKVRRAFTTDNLLLKILLAEFLGTFVLIVTGDGSVAQNVLSRETNGDFISVNLAWGFAVSMGVWVSGAVSGGHINPAVTLAACIMGRCPWIQLPIYWIGQYLGAFAASAVVYGVYYEALNEFDGGDRQISGVQGTAGIWATYPGPWLSVWGGLGDQVVSTGLLVMLILAITDDNNMKPSKGMIPFCVGLIVTLIGLSLGHNCGYAINPARDFGPRSFTACAGWGKEVFTSPDKNGIWWFWVPIVGPHIGAILGAWTYLAFVGNHIHEDDDDKDTRLARNVSDTIEMARQDPMPDYDIDHKLSEHRGVENHGYSGDRGPGRGDRL